MAVRVGEQSGEEAVSEPWRGVFAKGYEGGQEGEDPDVGEGGDDGTLLEEGGDLGDDEEIDEECELRWDGEEIGVEGGES